MAAPDPGLATLAADAEDPKKGGLEEHDGVVAETERPVAPDQFDEHYETSKWEIWAYYS
jgi:hypothetical protein